MEKYTDSFGTEISIGDTLVYTRSSRGSTTLYKGQIESFTKGGNPRVSGRWGQSALTGYFCKVN